MTKTITLAVVAVMMTVLSIPAATAAQSFHGKRAGVGDASTCTARIAFPEGKDELSLQDVKSAISQHLTGLGAKSFKVAVAKTADDVIGADIINANGALVRHLEVDAVTTQVISNVPYRAPLGLAAMADGEKTAQLTGKADYQRRLRGHMLGDGKAWAPWIGAGGSAGTCYTDYGFGAPDIN